nr:MAG TPA: hypothetical protein [Caudoviricetes sp.]
MIPWTIRPQINKRPKRIKSIRSLWISLSQRKQRMIVTPPRRV